ncbi:MAG TPA: hypothetical protein VG148_09525 [Pyrinomonadaceae bacterium]|nr:hypothetical protein [Pyrinomonadaceae bacterium]
MSKEADISELLRKKEERRRRLAKLPFEEKVAIVRRLQEVGRAAQASRWLPLSRKRDR